MERSTAKREISFICPVCHVPIKPTGEYLRVIEKVYDNSAAGWKDGTPRVSKIGECVECGYDIYINVKREVFNE